MNVQYDNLRTVIVEKREEILRTWSGAAHQQLGAENLTMVELRDHLPAFLDDVATALADGPPGGDAFRPSQHGRQRLRVGFDVAAVVRDYGMLGDAILRTAESAGYRPTGLEHRILLRELSEGAAAAVTSYAGRRDVELRDATTRHITFVAHELRNPLSAANMSLSMLSADGIGGEFAAKRLRALEGSIARLCHLVDDVLLGERFSGHVELHTETVGLTDLLGEVRADIALHAVARGVSVDCETEADQTFEGDRRLIHSALENVVRNAVKFTKPGGRVVMRARELESQIVFEVEDQCGGLPPGKLDELFQPFVQRSADRSGFGLGLAIAKHAVDAHRGKIHALDRPGSGCTFVIEIPTGTA